MLCLVLFVDRLTIDHLLKVLKLLWPARTRFFIIGLELGIQRATIDVIQEVHRNDTDECFRGMIQECFNQGLITKQKLAEAVGSPPVGFEKLREEILATEFTVSKDTRCKLIFMIIKSLNIIIPCFH